MAGRAAGGALAPRGARSGALLRQWDSERKVQAPLDAMEPIQIVAGLGGAALLLFSSVPSLLSLIHALNG